MKLPRSSSERFVGAWPARMAVALAAAVAASTAAADDWPALRSGLWEFDRIIELPGKPGNTQTVQTRQCTNPGEDMKKQNAMLTKAGCKFSPVVRTGNTYTYSAACTMQGASGTSKSVLAVESDGAYAIRVESDFGGSPTRELLRARRVGDCRQ